MTTSTTQDPVATQRRSALLAGCALLAMVVLAPFAEFYVLGGVVVADDVAATLANLAVDAPLVRAAIVAYLGVAILDVVVAVALHRLLAAAASLRSQLAAWLRVAYASVFVVAIAQLLHAVRLLDGALGVDALAAGQVRALVASSLSAFRTTWELALVVFGAHLLLLAAALWAYRPAPRVVSALVLVAALGYLADGVGGIAVPGYGLALTLVTFVGEVVLLVWLLWHGLRGDVARG